MATMIKPEWWDEWVILELYNPHLREGAPSNVLKEFEVYIRSLNRYQAKEDAGEE